MHKPWPLLVLALALSACAAAPAQQPAPASSVPTTAVSPTAAPADARAAAILDTMRAYEEVIRDGRTDIIAALTDSAPVRRFLSSAAAAAPPTEGAAHRTYQVLQVTEVFPGVVDAELARDDGRHARLLFRAVDTRWVLTEATEEELGERVALERGPLLIESYAGYPLTDAAAVAVERAYQRVAGFFGSMPEQQLRVVLKPAFGVGAAIPFDVQGFSEGGSRPRLVLTVPWSVGFRPFDPDAGWEWNVERLAAHELTHYVHTSDPALMSVNRAPAWVAEGLAEYVAAPLALEAARAIDAQEGWLPIAESDGPSLLEIELLPPKARTVAYVQAQLLIAYLAREEQAQLWAFINSYAASPGTGAARLDAVLRQSIGTDLGAFLLDWRSWVER